jgi:hypothetical protein
VLPELTRDQKWGKYTKMAIEVPNGYKFTKRQLKYQMAINKRKKLNSGPEKYTQIGTFWYESKPSGNPGGGGGHRFRMVLNDRSRVTRLVEFSSDD